MKKIFTFIFALGTISSVFAQSRHNESKDQIYGRTDNHVIYNTNDRHDAFSFDKRERDRQFEQINKDFDRQIKFVNRNRFLRPYEKKRQIRMLEAQRAEKMRAINERYDGRRTW